MSTTALTEEQEARAGKLLAEALNLKRDREHKDRYRTGWGTKTALGVWRTIAAMVDDARGGDIESIGRV